jgi:uncharacterized protein YecE (DUF72 family)
MYFIGTSGYSYKEWLGQFYPQKLAATRMLQFYAEHLHSVEINYSFYRMPSEAMVSRWQAQVPSEFRFVLKAPKAITHSQPLANKSEAMTNFIAIAQKLGPQLGPILFQLPPYFKKDLEKLAAFLALVKVPAAFEFRHASWQSADVMALLREHRCAWVTSHGEQDTPELFETASFGYLRLRQASYTREELQHWAARLRTPAWQDIYVFFKHEVDAPKYAKLFAQLLNQRGEAP